MSRINKWFLDDDTEIDFEDAEAVNQTDGELNDTIITYDGNTSDVQSWTDFIASFVNGTKVGKWFKNFRAGVDFLLHVGSLVNNCVTDNSELPLSAAQGKVLMDLYTELNDNLAELDDSMFGPKSCPDGASMDDLTESGIYRGEYATDWPLTNAGILLVFKYDRDFILQIAFNRVFNETIFRHFWGDGWTSWLSL